LQRRTENLTGGAGGGREEPASRSRYRFVFWDWNGTLLDDRDYAIRVRNRVFPRFGLPTVDSLEEYHRQFTFPVRLYYEQAGVTPENFVEVAHAWMDEYMRGCGEIPLQKEAREALEAFTRAGIPQAILSASQVDILEQQLDQYGIRDRFQEVLGLEHIYATSKEDLGKACLKRLSIPPESCVLLGDTLHDAQVAKEMRVDCILVCQGHQSRERLCQAGFCVCGSLGEAVNRVLGASLES
jgi:phosphoglycolate phosphatase